MPVLFRTCQLASQRDHLRWIYQVFDVRVCQLKKSRNCLARTQEPQHKNAGFSGVHVHPGHGFLLSQFLSPLFNRRDDGYGGSIEARYKMVLRVIDEVRRAVGPLFPIGIKINSTDKLEGGLTEDDALETVRLLDQTSVDLIDISGGTYFPGAKASSEGVLRVYRGRAGLRKAVSLGVNPDLVLFVLLGIICT